MEPWEQGLNPNDYGRWPEEYFVQAEMLIGNPGLWDPTDGAEDIIRNKVYEFLQQHNRGGVISFLDCWRHWRLFNASHRCVT